MNLPLIEAIPYIEPASLMGRLPQEAALLLESVSKDARGRYSFLAFAPFQILRCKNGNVFLNDEPVQDVFAVLRAQLQKYPLPVLPSYPPFIGGAAGVLGYELNRYLEVLPALKQDDLGFSDLLLGFYDLVFAWDHERNQVWLFSSGFPETEPEKQKQHAAQRLAWALSFLQQPETPTHAVTVSETSLISTFTQQTYEQAVERTIEYIRAGDIFEVNISQRFSVTLASAFDPYNLYRQLRKTNPAPFSAFMRWREHAVVSSSPERFLKLSQRQVEARPIKGTRKRGADPQADELLAQELLASEKDHAENVMIVDLMRNDLSRVCLPNTVKVPQLCALESYTTVHHLVSVVTGTLAPQYDAIDLIKATFPGGSITGAPKIRSMEIIAELEPTVRGPYCGSIGYIGFNGEMDLSITIRTFSIRDRLITFQVGGAITVDSSPTEEYEETLTKARGLQRALCGGTL